MARQIALVVFLLFFFSFSPNKADGHDYFTADQNPDTKHYLHLVEIAHTNKITDWVRQGRMNDAIADCKYTLDRFPNHPKGLMLVGMVAKLVKNPALAIAYYEKAIKLYPQYALTHAQYGMYLVDIGNMRAGIAKLQEATKIDPQLPQTYTWLAKAYTKSGNTELARQAALRAKELSSQSRKASEGSPHSPKE
jgi:tetratricopeptide (TPR) repeat protein